MATRRQASSSGSDHRRWSDAPRGVGIDEAHRRPRDDRLSLADKLLVLTPRGRDATAILAELAAAGIRAVAASAGELVAAVEAGELAAAVVTDEALAAIDLDLLMAALTAQPAWSDSAFLILTRRVGGRWTPAGLADLLGNVTVLERPLRRDVLVSGVRSALRARAQHRRAELSLLAREAAEVRVAELAATLEIRVAERTAALSCALAERPHSRQRLRDSEERYRYTIELTAQTPWTADAAGDLIVIGPGWANRSGTAIADWRSLVHADDLDSMLAAWTTATREATQFVFDFRIELADGALGWCRSRAVPRVASDGSVVRWYGTLEDIDDRRSDANKLLQMQSELIHVSRLSAMGTMASTLAHELNQPLTVITNYVRGSRRLLAGHPDWAVVRQSLGEADRAAVRAGEIIRRIRGQVSKGDVQCRPASLSDLVREACGLAMVDAQSSGIELRLVLARDMLVVMVDHIQIQQVLLNLLRNATEAVATSGTKRIIVTTQSTVASICEVTVADTGPGIAAAFADRLFEPFNSSKRDGMGVGLSISKTIVEAHGGAIWHEAAPDGGAIFGFSLVRILA